MPDPVRPVAPREEEWMQLIAKWTARADAERRDDWCNTEDRPVWRKIHDERAEVYDRCAAELAELLAVSPVPWAGSGAGEEEEELTRVDKGIGSRSAGSTAATD